MDKPKIAQAGPYIAEVNPGKYAWCACGLSKNQPMCDGSHKTTDIRPVIVEITEKKKVAWCGCKHSQNKPFCDGFHRNL